MSYTLEEALKNNNFSFKHDGEGLRIATFEVSRSTELLKENPNVHPVDDDWIRAEGGKNHSYYTTSPYMEYFPKAEVVCLPATNKGFNYAINEFKPHIVNMSLSDTMAFNSLEQKLSKQAVLLTSAGNSGEKGETRSARDEWWWAIGAVEMNDDFTPFTYSSWGLGKVRSAGIAGWTYKGSKPNHGTSFASPFVGLLLADAYCSFKQTHGQYPHYFTGLDMLRSFSEDIQELGKDLKTGYGMVVLPDEYEYNTLEFSAVPATINVSVNYKDAKAYYKNGKYMQMDTMAVIDQNNRTQLPLRVVAEHMGGTVLYRSENGVGKIKIIYIK